MYQSEYCDVTYREDYNIVLVKWKKFCCGDQYRKPLKHALHMLEKQDECNYAEDRKDNFAVVTEDKEWTREVFIPKAIEYGCNYIFFIIDNRNNLEEELEKQKTVSKDKLQVQFIFNLDEARIFLENKGEEIITVCGDNCSVCPRYCKKSKEELEKAAKLWYRVGFRDTIVSTEEIACSGCSSHKTCTYSLISCLKEHSIEKCNQCSEYPCKKIKDMLERTQAYKETCYHKCSKEEFQLLSKAFFEKEINLEK